TGPGSPGSATGPTHSPLCSPTWLLALVIVTLVLARAGPVPTSKPTVAGMGCPGGRFPSLLPREPEGFRRAKDALKKRELQLSPLPWAPGPEAAAGVERPVASEGELVLMLKVLGAAAHSTLGGVLDQPLRMPRHVCPELQACILARLRAGLPPRGRLHHWRHLQETVRWGPKAASRPLSRSIPSTSL
ncbi:hypothetical protein Celaphus_00008076, partial [Cervus elaphus hippelaphus]